MHYSRLMIIHKKKELKTKAERRYLVVNGLLMLTAGSILYVLGCRVIELYIKYQYVFW